MEWLVVLGVATGMRAMTAMAVMCWFIHLQMTPVRGWAFWAGNLVSAIVFSVLALGEYVGDTLPNTPNRTALFPAASRLVFGGLAGALAANTIHQPAAGGVVCGLLGAVVGTWGGFRLRAGLAKLFGRDLPAALLESALALALALWAAHRLALDILRDAKWWV